MKQKEYLMLFHLEAIGEDIGTVLLVSGIPY
jgi:hypothetical protein